MQKIVLRSATAEDAQIIAQFIVDLARYEQLEKDCVVTEEMVRNTLTSRFRPHLWFIIAEIDGEPVGMVVYYLRFSTFTCTWGIHLEDLYVAQEHRGRRVGTALIFELAKIAHQHGYSHVDLSVLAWNEGAQTLYERLGFVHTEGWRAMRMDKDTLAQIALYPNRIGIRLENE